MTNQTRAVAYRNTWLAAEWGRDGRLSDNTEYLRQKKGEVIRRRARDPLKVAADRRVLKYEGKGNSCPTCHMAVPTGTKECDNCG